jgi:hypothetical protein
MKKSPLKIVFIFLVLSCGPAYSSVISSNTINDFEDGLTHGWKKGANATAEQLPKIVEDLNGNHYLEVNSIGGKDGGRGPSSRMTFINETEWRGNYNIANVGSIKARMKNMSSDSLYMRVGFTTRASEEWHFAASKSALELPADGQWYDLSFAISEEFITPFLGGDGDCCFPEWNFEEVVAGVNQLKFHSGSDAHFWGGERVKSLLGVDDIRVSQDILQSISLGSNGESLTAVPVPAAGWLFLTGLFGFLGMNRKTRQQKYRSKDRDYQLHTRLVNVYQ